MSLKSKKIVKVLLFILLGWALYVGMTFYIYRDSYMCPDCKTYVNTSKDDYVYADGEYHHCWCYKGE